MSTTEPASLEDLGWGPFFQQQALVVDHPQLVPARIVAIQRTHVVLMHAGGVSDSPLGGRWFQREVEQRPAVGDWVLVDPNGMSVEQLLERRSVLKRMSPGLDGLQLIAANVDVLFLVTSCNADFNVRRLERYLALAYEAGVTPVVVLTKADLAEQPEAFALDARKLRAGLVVEVVNALDADSIASLATWCAHGQTVALLGSSGVGKSTLVNSLLGSQAQLTAEIREDDGKGRHTTTHRSLHLLPSGGMVLDSPGMRELGIAQVEAGVEAMFDDIEELSEGCRFADCAHGAEPGCAVQRAVVDGKLDAERFDSYLKLKREDAHNSETIAERHTRSRAFGKLTRTSQERKRRD
jgi:ribosome biogenesis GTPase